MSYPPRGHFDDTMGDINIMVPPQCRDDEDALRYEAAHREVFRAAVAWIDAHPDAKLTYKTLAADGLKVVGVLAPEGDDSRRLIAVMRLAAAEHGGWTGILIETCMENVFALREFGSWEAFIDFRRELTSRVHATRPA